MFIRYTLIFRTQRICMNQSESCKEEKKQFRVICAIVFMSFLNASIAYPIFPPLFLKSTANALLPLSWSETERLFILGLTLACFPLGQFIGSPILGRNSDRYGRKKMLLISLAGCGIGYGCIVSAFELNALWLLLLGQFITGFMEGTYTIATAFAADFKTINKYASFGRINSIGSLGYIAGPLFGGLLSDQNISTYFSYSLPFLFAFLATIAIFILVYRKLPTNPPSKPIEKEAFLHQFHIFRHIKVLLLRLPHLKHLLFISTLFTFSVDIFYEFSAIYLTGKWEMTPSMIAIYNIALSFALALGAIYIPEYLSRHWQRNQIITHGIFFSACIWACMVLFQHPFLMLIFFGLIGLGITTVTTTTTIHLSDMTNADTQGEVLGIQQSLRTLGDALICVFGGLVSILSIVFPMILSFIVAFLAALLSYLYLKQSKPS